MHIVHCMYLIDSKSLDDYHDKSVGINTTTEGSLEEKLPKNVMESEGIAASSETIDDIFNDARYLFQSQDDSFDSNSDKIIYANSLEQPGGLFQSQDNSFDSNPDNKIIYASSPERPGGFFHSFFPCGAIIFSPIAKLQYCTPREQSSNGLWLNGMATFIVYS